jgi:hypothetical protein
MSIFSHLDSFQWENRTKKCGFSRADAGDFEISEWEFLKKREVDTQIVIIATTFFPIFGVISAMGPQVDRYGRSRNVMNE